MSAIIAQFITDYVATDASQRVPVYHTTRGEDGAMTLSAEPAEYMPLPDHLAKV